MPKITLTQNEIVAAIKKSVGDMGFQTQGKIITVELTAGRKNNGHTAEVSIDDAPEVPVYKPEALVGATLGAAIATTVVEETVTEEVIKDLPMPEETVDTEVSVPSAPNVATDDLFDEA